MSNTSEKIMDRAEAEELREAIAAVRRHGWRWDEETEAQISRDMQRLEEFYQEHPEEAAEKKAVNWAELDMMHRENNSKINRAISDGMRFILESCNVDLKERLRAVELLLECDPDAKIPDAEKTLFEVLEQREVYKLYDYNGDWTEHRLYGGDLIKAAELLRGFKHEVEELPF